LAWEFGAGASSAKRARSRNRALKSGRPCRDVLPYARSGPRGSLSVGSSEAQGGLASSPRPHGSARRDMRGLKKAPAPREAANTTIGRLRPDDRGGLGKRNSRHKARLEIEGTTLSAFEAALPRIPVYVVKVTRKKCFGGPAPFSDIFLPNGRTAIIIVERRRNDNRCAARSRKWSRIRPKRFFSLESL